MRHPLVFLLGFGVLCLGASCGKEEVAPGAGDGHRALGASEIASRPFRPRPELPLAEDRACAECHPDIAHQWSLHGMADSLGPLERDRMPAVPTADWLQNARSGFAYRVQEDAAGDWSLQAYRPAPAQGWPDYQRSVPLGFRIGAGLRAMSFVLQEHERWNFAPLEFYTGHGWEPAPQELGESPGGLQHGITGACISCHSTDPAPDAYPLHALGDFAPEPIGCAVCHGPGQRHVDLMRSAEVFGEDLGILYPGDLSPERQLDLCARCHLEGDARIDFQPWSPQPRPGDALADARAVMVAKQASPDFSFVSQSRRLALSECFLASPEMTCSSCHDPHLPPRLQSTEDRLRSCMQCHAGVSPHGDPAPEDDCISCHMPRRHPYDLPEVLISDHNIGIHPRKTAEDRPAFRTVESRDGDWEVFRYREEDPLRYTPEELRALEAMTLAEKGYQDRALALFDTLPAPGTSGARPPAPQGGRPPVLRLAQFHFLRGRTLHQGGRSDEARTAYRDALALQPDLAEAGINLAWLLVEVGGLEEASQLAERMADRYPLSEAPWNVLFLVASERQDAPALERAAQASLQRRPDQPALLQALGRLHLAAGEPEMARQRLAAAFALDPDLQGIASDIAKAAEALR